MHMMGYGGVWLNPKKVYLDISIDIKKNEVHDRIILAFV